MYADFKERKADHRRTGGPELETRMMAAMPLLVAWLIGFFVELSNARLGDYCTSAKTFGKFNNIKTDSYAFACTEQDLTPAEPQGAAFKSGSRTKPQRRKGKAKGMEGTLSVDNLADLRTTRVS